MYAGLQKINDVIDYIEKNITSELDCKVLASKMELSVYEFRRIFSFVVGCPIAEYIRKRRLSLAALEIIKNKQTNILTLSEKYGYSSQSAFSKAFSEHHGVSPTAISKEKVDINLFTVPKFELKINSCENITFSVHNMDGFFIQGFSDVSNIMDTCCCENVWSNFYKNGADKQLNSEKIYVSYKNINDNDVLCTIGEKTAQVNGTQAFEEIPGTCWACFKLNTIDDDIVNGIYSKIICEWLPSANMIKDNSIPVVEVYPFDMSEDGFEWEICVPICK